MEGIIKQTNGAFGVVPATPGGLINGKQLTKIAQLVEEGAGLAKLTVGQHIVILTSEEKVEHVKEELAGVGLELAPVGTVVRNAKACPGNLCQFALQDALNDGLSLDKEISGRETPNSFKIGISGCPRNCMQARCNDVGLVGAKNGYQIYIGGKGGGKQVLGELLDKDISPAQLTDYIKHILSVYRENVQSKERLTSVVGSIGLDKFKK